MESLSLAAQAAALSRVVARQAADKAAVAARTAKGLATRRARAASVADGLLLLLSDGREHTAAELAVRLACKPGVLQRTLVALIDARRIERVGTHKPYRYRIH